MNFPLNIVLLGIILLLIILIVGADTTNTERQKCQYKNKCSYPHCECFKQYKYK